MTSSTQGFCAWPVCAVKGSLCTYMGCGPMDRVRSRLFEDGGLVRSNARMGDCRPDRQHLDTEMPSQAKPSSRSR